MANHSSALKRNRQNIKRHDRNRKVRSMIKTAIKKVRLSVEENKKEEAIRNFEATQKLLDTSATKHIIHRNNAANKKSRLMKLVNSL